MPTGHSTSPTTNSVPLQTVHTVANPMDQADSQEKKDSLEPERMQEMGALLELEGNLDTTSLLDVGKKFDKEEVQEVDKSL